MIRRRFTVFVLLLSALIVYLFVSAPAPLPEEGRRGGPTIPIAQALDACNAENAAVRGLYTKEIVGSGKLVGLAFNEDWRVIGVEAGPLPALFLRETAMSLEKNPVRLALFLGSDNPINTANLFQGEQARRFDLIKADRKPQFFVTADTGLQTAMFADVAVADACVSCHNAHRESPKHDWRLGDVMGATTWTYPSGEVTLDEELAMLSALRKGFHDAYSSYLDKAATFSSPPPIGPQWPRDGYSLPAVDEFMAEVRRRTSESTLDRLLAPPALPAASPRG
jgi:adenylate cyclase